MSHNYHCLHVHLVFATRGRQPLITGPAQLRLYAWLRAVLERERGTVLEIGGMPDHVHLLAGLRPTHSIAEIVHRLKGTSARWANEAELIPDRFGWQRGYGAFAVSQSQVASVCRYIERQPERHRELDFDAEWELLLARHGLSRATRSGDKAASESGRRPSGQRIPG